MQIYKGVMLEAGIMVAHPATPARAVAGVAFNLSLEHTGLWAICFTIAAPRAALRLPAPVEPVRADNLWTTTCLEMFLHDDASGRYVERNFSPSGAWAAYGFTGYRTGMSMFAGPAPRITTSDPAQFERAMQALAADFGLDPAMAALAGLYDDAEPANYVLSASLEAPPLAGVGPWSLGLAAVIEETDGTKSYWALHHPPGPPDFHHPDCFALPLPAPGTA